jgi:hypothetical protein
MDKELERRVRRRANDWCEYCLMPQSAYRFKFPIDHIIAKQHGGKTVDENLAEACLRCNSHKGPNIASTDTDTGELARIFHPRRDRWRDHFRWDGSQIVGTSPIGRATVSVLDMNHADAVAVREVLIAEGVFPPKMKKST